MEQITKNLVSTLELNRGGMFDYWNKEYTYKQNLYYVNHSGVLCRMPDQVNAMVEVKEELLEEERDLI